MENIKFSSVPPNKLREYINENENEAMQMKNAFKNCEFLPLSK